MIWSQKMRIKPQCRVTTPLWAPGADSGQREKKTNSGAKFGPKNDCSARPWGRRAVTLVSESCFFTRLHRPLSKCFTWLGCLLAKNVFFEYYPPTPKDAKTKRTFMGFPGTFARVKSRLRQMLGNRAWYGPMDLETKPQVDCLRWWRERSVAAWGWPLFRRERAKFLSLFRWERGEISRKFRGNFEISLKFR